MNTGGEFNSIHSVIKSDQHDGLLSPKWGKKLWGNGHLSLGTGRNELYRQTVIVKNRMLEITMRIKVNLNDHLLFSFRVDGWGRIDKITGEEKLKELRRQSTRKSSTWIQKSSRFTRVMLRVSVKGAMDSSIEKNDNETQERGKPLASLQLKEN